MTRVIYTANADELKKSSVRGCIMVDLDFASGHLYLNDGFHECKFNSHTFLPIGTFGGIDLVNETLDSLARPIKLTLSGVDPSLVGTAENEIYQNRPVIVYVALINQATGDLVALPECAWEGRADFMEISIEKNVGTITLNCEHRLRREPRIARYTNADQQTAYAGDVFFDYTATIPSFKAAWGSATVSHAGPSVAGGGGGGVVANAINGVGGSRR